MAQRIGFVRGHVGPLTPTGEPKEQPMTQRIGFGAARTRRPTPPAAPAAAPAKPTTGPMTLRVVDDILVVVVNGQDLDPATRITLTAGAIADLVASDRNRAIDLLTGLDKKQKANAAVIEAGIGRVYEAGVKAGAAKARPTPPPLWKGPRSVIDRDPATGQVIGSHEEIP